ncbi:alpha/beta-hydrolase, partial [Collybia nuda]
EEYNDLEFYYKYASSAYAETCNKPNGNILVSAINESSSDTQGFIARDDGRKEIVLSFRGSTSAWDWLTNFQIVETPFIVANISGPAGVMVHTGFLTAQAPLLRITIEDVQSQLVGHPKYSVVTTGHSLGGALSTLAGITLKQILPDVKVRIYTYGQPRVGNAGLAKWVDTSFGHANLFRSVHTTDTVPHLPPTLFLPNYTHHGIEYWSFKDPSSAANTKKCALTGEDPKCS